MKNVYVDHAATTPIDPLVLEKMNPYHSIFYGNASSLHSQARKAEEAIDEARVHISSSLGASPDEIVFTSGGTESDNLAIKGSLLSNTIKKQGKGPHIITSSIEHPAILNTCKYLEKQGYNVSYLGVDKHGLIKEEDLANTITKETLLVSIMFANNEIGTIQPIQNLASITHEHNAVFHTDAVQAIGKVPIDVEKMGIDLLSLSGHKIYGPKGIGALYKKKDQKLEALIHGGGHEHNLRSGTSNTPGIVGLGEALYLSKKRMKKDNLILQKFRDQLIKSISTIEESYLNGHRTKRLVNNAHFRFTAIEGESLIMLLDDLGIMASTGSACSSTNLIASHVLTSIGLKPEESHGSLRLTLGRTNTKEEINYIIETLPDIVRKLRDMSPLWIEKRSQKHGNKI